MDLRQSFSPAPPEVFEAALLLKEAVSAHLAGDVALADSRLRAADNPLIGEWLDPIWTRRSPLVKAVRVEGLPPILPKNQRHHPRTATTEMRKALVARDGHHCRFCGIPLIRPEIRKLLNSIYPEAARWTSPHETNQHRGLQVMWMQYDHVVVHSRGGLTDMDNLVVACVACNFGRDRFTLEEMRMSDPRTDVRLPTWHGRNTWTGLEEILPEQLRWRQAPDSPFVPR